MEKSQVMHVRKSKRASPRMQPGMSWQTAVTKSAKHKVRPAGSLILEKKLTVSELNQIACIFGVTMSVGLVFRWWFCINKEAHEWRSHEVISPDFYLILPHSVTPCLLPLLLFLFFLLLLPPLPPCPPPLRQGLMDSPDQTGTHYIAKGDLESQPASSLSLPASMIIGSHHQNWPLHISIARYLTRLFCSLIICWFFYL